MEPHLVVGACRGDRDDQYLTWMVSANVTDARRERNGSTGNNPSVSQFTRTERLPTTFSA